MQVQASLPTISVKNIIERISTTRQITRLDQRLLMSALSTKDSLDAEEQNLINRIYDDIKISLKGCLKNILFCHAEHSEASQFLPKTLDPSLRVATIRMITPYLL